MMQVSYDEFVWPSDLLPEVTPVEGPPPPVKVVAICKALSKMKCVSLLR